MVFAAVLLVAGAAGLWYYLSTRGYRSTDDAFIAANVYRVSSKVDGRLTAVPAMDNAVVEAGATLAEIDPADFQARVDRAVAALELAKAQAAESQVQVTIVEASTAAALEQAKAEREAAEARLQEEQAGLESARAESSRAGADLERYSHLSDRAVTAQRLDVVRSAATTAEAQVRAAEKRVASAVAGVTASRSRITAAEADRERVAAARAEVDRRRAEVRQAEASLVEARLELSYCTLRAPAAGRVTNKSALEGDYVKAGQSVMALVSPEVWVVANFKETQLRAMRPGQPVRIHVDAYDADFDGHVESIQSGSGAQFSLLPPQNATGNYVKVVQRVPVKIVFERTPDPAQYQLGPGMSVVPRVRVR
jgi:membrane fusion protein (multidrug efflux system)